MKRVVVSGMGIVSSIGNDTDQVLTSLREAKSGITTAQDYVKYGFKCQVQGEPDLGIRVSGYTDSSGPEEYNLLLSEKRTESVASYLRSRGIDASRIEQRGYGESSPMADNATRDGRSQNRRVELQILQ